MRISKGIQYMIVATLLLAIMQVLVKALPGIPIYEIILIRAILSSGICFVALKIHHISLIGRNIPLLTIRGIVGTISLMSFFYTLHHIPLATAVTIGNLSPLFLGLLAVLFLKERMIPLQWLFFVISFGGVFLIKGFDTRITNFELTMAVASAFLAALAHFTVRMLKDEHPNVILFYFSLIVLPILGPYTFFHWTSPNEKEWILLILVALVSHVAQYFLTKAFKKEEITRVAGIYYLGIIFALLMGYFIYDEAFNLYSYLGMLLIITGVVLNLVIKKIKLS